MSWRDYVGLIPSAAAVLNGFIAVFVAQFFRESRRARLMLVGAVGLLGVAAIGATIYSQHALIAEQQENRDKRVAIREALGAFVAEGDNLMTQCANAAAAPPVEAADAWSVKVEAFLLSSMGKSYVERFRNATGVPYLLLDGADPDHQRLWFNVNYRVTRLQQFSQEVPF